MDPDEYQPQPLGRVWRVLAVIVISVEAWGSLAELSAVSGSASGPATLALASLVVAVIAVTVAWGLYDAGEL